MNQVTESILDARTRLNRAGYPESTPMRILPDGRTAWIHRLMYTYAILVSEPENMVIGYDDRWCFTEEAIALHALEQWDGIEPQGWIRHPRTGRRRPGGDATKEYVEP